MQAALVSVGTAVLRAAIFAAVNFACLAGDAVFRRQEMTDKLSLAFLLFAAGAALACLMAWPLAGLLARRRPPSVRLAAILLLLMAGTAGFAAFFFFLQTRQYYAAYYPAEATFEWLFHFAFTGAGAAYQVGVLGVRYFLPLGLIPLFTAAFIFAAEPRRRL
ncbi:hypothetical protein BH10PSE9_BH10PSE9_02950 [soil metagenome]